MSQTNKKDLFDLVLERVRTVGQEKGMPEWNVFGRWFAEMYFQGPHEFYHSDGSRDGKIDLFFKTNNGRSVKHHILNTKFTQAYNQQAPKKFYEEIAYFAQTFLNAAQRDEYLTKAVKGELRQRYRELYDRFDDDAAELVFVTNCTRNDGAMAPLSNLPVKIFHLDEIIQHLIDDLDATMPRTPDLELFDIHMVLSPDRNDTSVATSIVFARLYDFVNYMKADPFDLLFARNVRVWFGIKKYSVNEEIRDTFRDHPEEFAFSNNGITILCEKHQHDPGEKKLLLVNPRVVNGSQTLHSIRDVANPSRQARAMVRIIEIPPFKGEDIDEQVEKRRDTLNKISVRSNRQNPIKKWDLVSNDDFQLAVYRLFRLRGWFYERRVREWRQRSRELKSVGIRHAVNIKNLTQYIVSYYWNKPKMGPATAKRETGDLFEREIYEQVQKTPREVVYQIFQVSDNIRVALSNINNAKYTQYRKTHMSLALFSLLVRAFQEVNVKWGSPDFTTLLDDHADDWVGKRASAWNKLTRCAFDHIYDEYQMEVKRAKKKEDEIPTIINYFKNQKSIANLLKKPLPAELKRLARKTLES
jgi:hypothetical protein